MQRREASKYGSVTVSLALLSFLSCQKVGHFFFLFYLLRWKRKNSGLLRRPVLVRFLALRRRRAFEREREREIAGTDSRGCGPAHPQPSQTLRPAYELLLGPSTKRFGPQADAKHRRHGIIACKILRGTRNCPLPGLRSCMHDLFRHAGVPST